MRLSSSFRIGFQVRTLVRLSKSRYFRLSNVWKPNQGCSSHQFSHFMITKLEKKIFESYQNKINNYKKESKSLLVSMIFNKKPTAGWELDAEKEKPILKKNFRQIMKIGWEPPRQLPIFSKSGFCSNKPMPTHQTQHSLGLKLNVSTPSGQKGRGRPRKRKRSERLTDSEEESGEEVV